MGDEKEQGGSPGEGLNMMDKTLLVRGARISYSIWEVTGLHNIYFLRSFILRAFFFFGFLMINKLMFKFVGVAQVMQKLRITFLLPAKTR